jgi:type II secretory pathway pseudopilin PulG
MTATRSGAGGATAPDTLATSRFRALAAGAARIELITIARSAAGGATINATLPGAHALTITPERCRSPHAVSPRLRGRAAERTSRARLFADRTDDHPRRGRRSRHVVVPVAQTSMQRSKEQDLRLALRELRHAIDLYKKASDEGRIRKSAQRHRLSEEPAAILVDGEEDLRDPKHRKIYFLRRIPRDPMHPDTACRPPTPGPNAPTPANPTTHRKARTSTTSIRNRAAPRHSLSTASPTANGDHGKPRRPCAHPTGRSGNPGRAGRQPDSR